jgi:hypothetical protein
MSLHLAMLAVEGIFGEARVRLEAAYHLDEARRAIIVDGAMPVGATVAHVFTSFLLHEFGDEAFEVRRVPTSQNKSGDCEHEHESPRKAEVTK